MVQSLILRTAQLQDIAPVAALCGQLGYPVEAEQVSPRLEAILRDPHQAIFVLLSGEQVIGWVHVLEVIYLESQPFAEIGGLVVDAAARRLGAGRQLMAAAECWARERQLSAVRLRSNVIREGAHAFYQSLGYQIIKTQYTFYKALA